jgi:CRISPR-associated endonuclease Csn1
MRKVLGLDLGTTSIGWALVNEAENENEVSSIIRAGVRVNPLTVDEQQNFEKGKPITTNAERTLKRGARRGLQRYKLRRKFLKKVLAENGLIGENFIFSEEGTNSTFQILGLRAKAANEKIALEDFARVLFNINKKRGYKSSRKAKSEDEGHAIDGMAIAKLLHDNNLTPGQYAHKLLLDGKKVIPDFYRSDLYAEFEKVWNCQQQFYPHVLTNAMKEEISGKTAKVSDAIFCKAGLQKAETPKGADRKLTEYQWRADAATQQIDLTEFVYVISKINADINSSSGYLGAISDRSKELYFNNLTVGQYLYAQVAENPHARLKNQVFYRQDYEDEFETIWNTQAKYYPQLNEELKKLIKDVVIFFQRPLKSQKGLISFCEFESRVIEKEVDGKMKKVTIGSRVIPRSSPLFQHFKIWQIINNLLVIDENGLKSELDEEQKNILFTELNWKGKMTSGEVLKLLFKNHRDLKLNYENVEGNNTNQALLEAFATIFEITGHDKPDFKKMSAEEILKTMEEFFESYGYNKEILSFNPLLPAKEFDKQAYIQLWHLLYSFEGDDSKTGNASLIKKINEKFGFPQELAAILANVTFQDDYGSLSAKAIREILPYLQQGNKYDVACEYAGYRHSKSSLKKDEIESRELKERLEILSKNSLRNPVVEKILNQMINVVNAVCDAYGKPDEIRVEMARELKQSAKERQEATSAISKATAEHEKYVKILKDEFGFSHVSRNDLIRYKLYLELEPNGFKTLYSNQYIPREKLFSKEFDIEHIIPQSRLYDDSFSNKTIELRSVNLKKSNDTALDYVATLGSEELEQYKARVNGMKNLSLAKRKKLLMSGENIPDGFIERDLRDTQYIAKKAKELLEEVFRKVTTTTGKVTDKLREDWQLIDVMKELNWNKYHAAGLTEKVVNKDGQELSRIKDWTKRNDHRHHAMDAITVAFTRPSHIQYLNFMNARRDQKHKKASAIFAIEQKEIDKENGKLLFKPPMPLKQLRAEVKNQLESILVSHKGKNKVATININKIKTKNGVIKEKQSTPRGQLHNETVYGSVQQYATKEEKVNASFDEQKIAKVAKKSYREALLKRMQAFDNDPQKAFTGKNALVKNPLYTDESQRHQVPEKVKLVDMQTVYTIRKDVGPDLKVDKVVDLKVRKLLQERLNKCNGDAKTAFSNLEENPIWLNEAAGIPVKRVTITGVSNAVALHNKKDKYGRGVLDESGNTIPVDFVNTGNNHHVAIYRDENGNLQDEVVSFYEAVERKNVGMPIIKRQHENGSELCFTMKQNECFVFPNENTGFNPAEIDLLDEKNYAIISPNLFRVQKFSRVSYGNSVVRDYVFRHHLETTINDIKTLRNSSYIILKSLSGLSNCIKVRLNHLGKIVHVGEY